MMRLRSPFWLMSAVLLVAGCGGGGSGTQTQKTPTISAWPTASTITYGQTLASSTLSGGSASVAGSFAWTAPTTAPSAGTPSESVTFTPTDTTDYTTVTGSVPVTVGQATPTVSAWPTASSIAYGQTLASSSLNGGTASVAGTFAWTTPTTAPGIGVTSESVTFTPSDAADYSSVTGSVSVSVDAAAPTVSAWPTASGITYGQTLASSTLTGGTASVAGTFAWTTPTTAPSAGAQSESVTFTPTNTTDYTAVVGAVTVTVSKATPTVSAWPTASPITMGQTLESSTLAGGTASVSGTFAWTSPTTAPSLGTDSESVTFTPSLTADYNTVTGSVNVTVNPIPVTVDFGTTYQTIRGFGGSTAWLGALTTQQATALFNQSSGLGLSILRVRIDPTGSATTTPYPYSNSAWAAELTNAQEEIAANSNAITFASPWTPPVSMKSSSTSQPYYSGCSPTGTCGGYLPLSNYAAYATYLQDFVNYFANNGNSGSGPVNLYAISMQNEPDYADVDYESCYWTPDQMDAFVETLSGPNALGARLIMPESFQFLHAQSDPTLNDPNANGNVSIVGGHLYGVVPVAPQANYAGKDIWMTEHALTPTGSQPAIGDALALAEEIHNGMVTGQYNAYVYWWIWDNPADGINYGLINSNTTSPAPTYYGYAIGQFSKFIQPGFVRVSATASPLSGVYISAYNYPSTGSISYPDNYVIVAINANASSEPLSFTLNNGSEVTSLTVYQTTSAAGLTTPSQSPVTVTSGTFTYTLSADSITTFVQ